MNLYIYVSKEKHNLLIEKNNLCELAVVGQQQHPHLRAALASSPQFISNSVDVTQLQVEVAFTLSQARGRSRGAVGAVP